jgi:multidrug efflux pump
LIGREEEMSFTDLFVKRPVVATVVNLIVFIAGYQAIRSINVRQYPRSDLSVITVTTVYYGADSDLVRGFLTTPLEQSIASADGIDYMESSSTPGTSTISVYLKLNYDPNAALAQIQTKVEQVRNQLPPASQLPVLQITSTDNQFASMYLSFFSNDLDRNQITDRSPDFCHADLVEARPDDVPERFADRHPKRSAEQ